MTVIYKIIFSNTVDTIIASIKDDFDQGVFKSCLTNERCWIQLVVETIKICKEQKFSRAQIFAEQISEELIFSILAINRENKFRET